ncbi:hypothetical protein LJR009_001620 [Bosea sp. LjRoot9]|uniref:hypothetical protein n=1 Tax=Bosea sp. LjRoot9 TaxID=3342341 RepID=UPI003ECF780C
MSRPISDAWFFRIKAATRDLVSMCGGVVRAGEIGHCSKTEMSRYQVQTDESIIPIPVALALEAHCEMPLITTVLADLHGRRVSTPDEATISAASVFARHVETVRSAAELMATGAAAAADGKLTPSELELLDRAAAALEKTLAPLRQDIAAHRAVQLRVV